MHKIVKLGDVSRFIRGITFTPDDVIDAIDNDSVGCMRTKNVQEQIDLKDVWFLNKKFIKDDSQFLCEGDLLVSSANSWNLVGKACWVPKLEYKCTFGGFVSVLRADTKLIDEKYLYFWFTSSKIQAKLRSFGQKTTNISNLNLKRTLDMEIELPAMDEQKIISAKLEEAEAILRLHQLGASKAKELVSVMQKELLRIV